MTMTASLRASQTLEDLLGAVETHHNIEALLKGSRADSWTRLREQKDTPTAVYPEPTVSGAKGPQRDGWGRADP